MKTKGSHITPNGTWLVVRYGILKTKFKIMIERLFEKLGYIKKDKQHLPQANVMPSLPLQDLIEFCERNEDFYNDEENYSKDANTFYNAALTFTKFWAEKTYGNGA